MMNYNVQLQYLYYKWLNKKREPSQKNTFENDLHNEANFDVSFGEIKAMLQPSAEALAVLPLL